MPDKNSCNGDLCQDESQLLRHLKAVLQHNRITNLTSIKNIEAGKVFHIEDSLAVLPEVGLAPEGAMADIGSGAGYPGIPLALLSKRQTTLIEANNKKASFLQDFIAKSKLTNLVTVSALRSEELALIQREAFAVVTARAVAELPTLLELASPLLMPGGHFLALKGRPEAAELERGDVAAGKLGMKLLCSRHYTLSDNVSQRCVLVYIKSGQASVVLPRRPGMAAKRPLG